MPLDTKPWRVLGVAYAVEHGLPLPHEVDEERGFDVHAHKPLGKPGHHFFERLQRHMIAAGHKKVKVTGTITKETREVLAPPLTRGELIANWALTQVGVHETPWGTNRGADVRRYQSSTRAYGAPWCASFVSYGYQKFGYQGQISARAYDWEHFGTEVPPNAAKRGDPVVIHHGDGHIGLFLNVQPNGEIRMVSGNTNNAVGVGDYKPSASHIIRTAK